MVKQNTNPDPYFFQRKEVRLANEIGLLEALLPFIEGEGNSPAIDGLYHGVSQYLNSLSGKHVENPSNPSGRKICLKVSDIARFKLSRGYSVSDKDLGYTRNSNVLTAWSNPSSLIPLEQEKEKVILHYLRGQKGNFYREVLKGEY